MVYTEFREQTFNDDLGEISLLQVPSHILTKWEKVK